MKVFCLFVVYVLHMLIACYKGLLFVMFDYCAKLVVSAYLHVAVMTDHYLLFFCFQGLGTLGLKMAAIWAKKSI